MAEEKKKQVRVIMWGTPRSLSTAIFRAMWNKKSCRCLPEPYAMSYFVSSERVFNWYPEIPFIEEFKYPTVKEQVYDTAYEEDEVFIKDFAAYIYNQTVYNPEELIPEGYVHIFLIRPVDECVKSGYRVFSKKEVAGWTEWDSRIIGFQQLWKLYNVIKEKQPNPLVIHSEDVSNYPEATLRLICERTGLKFEDSMLNWKEDDGLQAKLDSSFPFLKPFTGTVLATKGFTKGVPRAEVELPPEIQRDVEEENVYYEKLLQLATRVTPPQQ